MNILLTATGAAEEEGSSRVLIVLLFLIVVSAGIIFLQIYLSKRESRWSGLVLPFIAFTCSLLMVFSISVIDKTGWEVFGLITSTFFVSSIPTIVLLAIYFGCRENIKRKKELEKMSVQDLD